MASHTTARSSSSSASSDSSFDEADDQDWADWVDDDDQQQGQAGALTYSGQPSSSSAGFKIPTKALFATGTEEVKTFDSPLQVLSDAKSRHGVDLVAIVRGLGLDTLQVIRLVNHIRRNQVKPEDIAGLKGDEGFLSDDKELMPVDGFEDDGLLQLDFDDIQVPQDTKGKQPAGTSANKGRVQELESELHAIRLAFQELQQRYMSQIGLSALSQESASKAHGTSPIAGSSKTSAPVGAVQDNDTHYFNSYASNDIHQTMIEDSVRTLTYAHFLLAPENAHLIRDKVVMDIGCGSGILSLFAARAGAKKVIAIDASDVAHRAKENIESNGFGHVIKVYKGKVEDLQEDLQEFRNGVDLLISEWMGYFLLYESMLPSVLIARDLYLNKEGTLAPSHCRMTLTAVSNTDTLLARSTFWDNVYGFKMPSMAKGLELDAFIETISPDSIVSNTVSILDLPLQEMKATQPYFKSPFTLQVEKDCQVNGFLSWFDTWFIGKKDQPVVPDEIWGKEKTLNGGINIPDLPPVTTEPITKKDVPGIDLTHNSLTPSPPTTTASVPISFTTGPQGKETHWKQTIFLLKSPISVTSGNIITGEIAVLPTKENTRELDVEIHYCLRQDIAEHQARERKEVKKVEARCVQLWAVR
ncbi:unnamed protein product [Sympodiomycopsis kandeliae]